ncbi:MAG TPA: Yip1 family protein [Gemmatimonadaceae bacterium]|nr:Yip1 family protein [Gemmatimonadaceae bacterium]
MTEPASAASEPQASLWEDFIDIFTSPSQVYRRRQNAGFGMPFLVLVVLFLILLLGTKGLVQPALDADMARQGAVTMRSHPQITADQLQKQGEFFAKIGSYVFTVILAISVLLTGLVLWLAGKIFDSKQTASQGMMVATYAFFPKVLAFVGGALIAYFSNPDRLNGMTRLSVGVGAFLNPDKTSPVLLALLARVDVFTIWETVLLAIGLQITGKVSKTNAYLAAAIVWFVGALPALLSALRQ